jgi:hypothetical protein
VVCRDGGTQPPAASLSLDEFKHTPFEFLAASKRATTKKFIYGILSHLIFLIFQQQAFIMVLLLLFNALN